MMSFQGEMPVILEVIEKKIPIFFIVNKCPDEIFDEDNEAIINILETCIKDERKDTVYVNFKTYFINSLNYKGFDNLLKRLEKHFSTYYVNDKDLEDLKNATLMKTILKIYLKIPFFLGKLNLNIIY